MNLRHKIFLNSPGRSLQWLYTLQGGRQWETNFNVEDRWKNEPPRKSDIVWVARSENHGQPSDSTKKGACSKFHLKTTKSRDIVFKSLRMCEKGFLIAFESQEGLQGRRTEVLKRSLEISKSFNVIQRHSKSFEVIQSHRIQVLLRAAEQKQCCRRRGLQPSHLAALDSNGTLTRQSRWCSAKTG